MKLRVCMQDFDNRAASENRARKILLANDLDLFLAAENTFYRRRDIGLVIARSGEEAIALARVHRPDLVFLDLVMEGMDGDACCRTMRVYPELRFVPVVLITEGSRRQDLDRCCEAGCDEVMTKPLDRQMLLRVSRKFLDVEERSSPRVPTRLRVQVRQGARFSTGYAVDLSYGGMFLETPAPAPIDSALELRFSLPGTGSAIRCRGRVTWVNHHAAGKVPHLPPGMGIEFADLATRDREAIEDFVKRRFIVQMRSGGETGMGGSSERSKSGGSAGGRNRPGGDAFPLE